MRPLGFLLTAWLGWVTAVGAGVLDDVSHRDKLYDIAVQGQVVLVVGYPGLMLRSEDAGASFAQVDVKTKEALFSIAINSQGLTAVVGRAGLVLISQDAGKTWSQKDSGIKENFFAVEVSAAGQIWAVGHFGTIAHSPDGGQTWQAQEYDASPPQIEGEDGAAGISSAEEENEGAAEEARLNAVTFADEKLGWIAGEFGMVLHTQDGGASWKRQVSASGKLLFSAQAISAQRVLMAGSEGTFMETRDGGTSWQLIDTGVTEHILGLWPQGERIFLVGRDGMILVSTGQGYKRLPAGLFTWLNAVQFIDDQHGFVVGGRGHLLKTSDAGKSWQRLSGR